MIYLDVNPILYLDVIPQTIFPLPHILMSFRILDVFANFRRNSRFSDVF